VSESNQVQRLQKEENGADPRVSQFVSNLDPSTELSLPSTIISLKSDPLDFELGKYYSITLTSLFKFVQYIFDNCLTVNLS